MLQRWLTAAVGIPVLVGLCLWNPVAFGIAILVVTVVALLEMVRCYRLNGVQPNPLLATAGLCLSLSWTGYYLRRQGPVALDAAVALALLAPVWEILAAARGETIQTGRRVAYGLLCGGYVAFFGALPLLRMWAGGISTHPVLRVAVGCALVLLTFCCVWATDSFAFFVGRAIGKHKLAPRLSPAKTVEGAIGGLLAAVVVGAVFGWLLLGYAPGGALAGAVAGTLGQAGDLFESALKRELGIKDFGGILPGHGGVLDRFDGLLLTAPAVYLLLPWIIPPH